MNTAGLKYTYFETRQYLRTGIFQIDWQKINMFNPANAKSFIPKTKNIQPENKSNIQLENKITGVIGVSGVPGAPCMIKYEALNTKNIQPIINYNTIFGPKMLIEDSINVQITDFENDHIVRNNSYPHIVFHIQNKNIREMFCKYLNEYFDPRNFDSSEKAYVQIYIDFLKRNPIATYSLLILT